MLHFMNIAGCWMAESLIYCIKGMDMHVLCMLWVGVT